MQEALTGQGHAIVTSEKDADALSSSRAPSSKRRSGR